MIEINKYKLIPSEVRGDRECSINERAPNPKTTERDRASDGRVVLIDSGGPDAQNARVVICAANKSV